MKLRTGLLLGAAFGAGVAVGPVSGFLATQTGFPLLPAALAQDGGRAETYRLLTLFGDVFERVRAEYVEPVNDRDLVENAINGMLTGLDPHSNYMNAKSFRDMQVQTHGEFGGLGIEVTQDNGFIKVISPIDDTPASRAGIKSGDLILALDGQTVQGLSLNDAVDKMRGPPNSKIKLTIRREGQDTPLEVPLTREVIRIQVVKSHLEGGDIAYVRVTSFNEQTDAGLRKALAALKAQAGDKLRGIILDLRNNPGGLLDAAVDVAEPFFRKGELIVYTQGRKPGDREDFRAESPGDPLSLPIAILINSGTASAAEIVTGALKDTGRAVIVGERSFGKGSVQSIFKLKNGEGMRLTTAHYYTPSGVTIHQKGIDPQVEVVMSADEDSKLRQQGLRPDLTDAAEFVKRFGFTPVVDRQLQAAIDVLKGVELLDEQTARTGAAKTARITPPPRPGQVLRFSGRPLRRVG